MTKPALLTQGTMINSRINSRHRASIKTIQYSWYHQVLHA